jgi:hypothetical protein
MADFLPTSLLYISILLGPSLTTDAYHVFVLGTVHSFT